MRNNRMEPTETTAVLKKIRCEWMDIAKGIGIILVVLGHLNTEGQLNREVIYAFHMPLFFLLSGVFASSRKNFSAYFKNLITRLYVPYAVFVTADVVLGILIGNTPVNLKNIIILWLKGIAGFGFNDIINRPLWFLFALFLIKAACFFLNKFKPLKYIAAAAALSIVFFSEKLSLDYANLWLVALVGLPFFVLGDLLKNQCITLEKTVNKHKVPFILLIFLASALLLFTAHKNGSPDISKFIFGNGFLYLLNAALGIMIFSILSVFLTSVKPLSRLLQFYGKNSIIILILHYYICRNILPVVFQRLHIDAYLYSFYTEVLLTVLVMLVMTVLIFICSKYFYFLFGMKKPAAQE